MSDANPEPVGPGVDEIAERLLVVDDRLQAVGRSDVKVVAVAKTFPAASVLAAMSAGCFDIGESYAQEFVTKHAEVTEAVAETETRPPVWHFVGGLQRNKVRKIASLVDLWHSVDRAELAAEIAKHAPGAAVLLQVNISGEDAKKGCSPEDLDDLMTVAVDAGLSVVGLMGMAPLAEPEAARPGFRTLRHLADTYDLTEVSMGMSADLEVAAQEGATIVRVGSGLFGPRR